MLLLSNVIEKRHHATHRNIADRGGTKEGTLLLLLVARELWMLYLFAVILGFSYGGLAAIELPIVAELFGLSSHGVIMGVASSGYTTGGAVGSVVAGRIFDSYQIAFLVCIVVCVLGIILAWRLTPPVSGGRGE